jgi:uncharacterized protein YjbI with pentapeptide repeats
LTRADLTEANLEGANLEGTILYKAKITDKQLGAVKSLKNATLPDGTRQE